MVVRSSVTPWRDGASHRLAFDSRKWTNRFSVKDMLNFFVASIYVFADAMEQEHGVLYVLDQRGSVVKEISLPTSFARSMAVFHGRLVIATKPRLTIVDPHSWRVAYWGMGQEETQFDQLYVKGDTLWVSYVQRGKSGWLALNDQFNIFPKEVSHF
ncbi:hypothetical protein B4114_0305 [Geobacillus stearothermophilus]|uniref:Uncharacterized protein n=1 Tax=Geobacillus stearothermophilus TaxID=1422 RepID=A0A150ND79_GEOSE|nr:hypothetical protein B4114_0305 [Geobacillus stearothermophilus]